MESRIRTSKGFTLIELLVVIAIIAILAAILFPVFLAAKEKGNQTKCMSNMRQLALGMTQYTDTWNGAFPVPWVGGGGSPWYGPNATWRERVKPYVKNSRGSFLCAAKNHVPDGQAGTTGSVGAVSVMSGVDPTQAYSHYGIAVGLSTPMSGGVPGFITVAGTPWFGFTYMFKLQEPSQTIMIAENQEGDWSVEPMTAYGAYGWGGQGRLYTYHLKGSDSEYSGGGNFIFCDGHVKFMTVNAAESLDTTAHTRSFKYWIADKSIHITPLSG